MRNISRILKSSDYLFVQAERLSVSIWGAPGLAVVRGMRGESVTGQMAAQGLGRAGSCVLDSLLGGEFRPLRSSRKLVF